jgi:uncharacterized protein (TIGR02145 family)
MKRIRMIVGVVTIVVFIFQLCGNVFGQALDTKPLQRIIDTRDEKAYPIVKIGTQTWMAENLAFKTWSGSCFYDNDELKGMLFGRLYTWNAAKEACPTGWHLPDDSDWKILIEFVGENPCYKLKSDVGFWPDGLYGNDTFKFSVFGSGHRSNNSYNDFAKNAWFWSSSPITSSSGWGSAITFVCNADAGKGGIKVLRGNHEGSTYSSVRCIKDE